MFHRVKSEVQDAEQKEEQGPANTGYKPSGLRQPAYRAEQEEREEEQPAPRSYTYRAAKSEEESPKMRSNESSQSQGKYAREQEESETTEAPSRPGGYQPSVSRGSYSGGSSYSSNSSSDIPAYSAGGNDRVLTIGRGINMSGEIDACDHLMVEGTVEAALKGAKALEIAESGTFYGTVEIEEATIAGRFEGDITVNGRLTLKSSGVITGSIAYRELEVEAGAVLDGRTTPLKGTVDPKAQDKYRAGTGASAMAKAKAESSKKPSREPANAESGLFSKAHASY